MSDADLKRPDLSAPGDASHDNAKCRQILDGARRVFLSDGFDGASMNDVARAAGVSKGTLYVYFDSKEALFEALIRAERGEQAERFVALDDAQTDVPVVLTAVATALLEALAQPQAVAHVRMVLGVAAKFPQIGRAFYEAGPLHGAEKLAVWLERQNAAGRLVLDDPLAAAHQFFDLAKAGLIGPLYFGLRDTLSKADIDRNVRSAVRLFMASYGVRTDSTSPRT